MLDRFVEQLRQDINPPLQFESNNIASGTTHNTQAVVLAGAVPQLVRLLASPNEDIREQAVWTLGNIAGDSPAFRDMVLRAGIVPPLLRYLVPEAKKTFIRNATWTISNLCRGKMSILSVHRELIPLLAKLIDSRDEEVLRDSLWALSYLTNGEKDSKRCFLNTGTMVRLVELLGNPNPNIVTPALRTVGNLVTEDDLCTQSMLTNGTLPHVARLLKSKSIPILRESCWLVSNVCAGTQDKIQTVLDANIVPLLIRCMMKGDPEVAKEATCALSNATLGGNLKQVWSLVQSGIIGPFHGALNRAGSARIQNMALRGLENILNKPPTLELDEPRDLYKNYMTEEGLPATLTRMLSGTDKLDTALLKKAEEMMEKHWPHWDDYGREKEDYGEKGEMN